MIICPSMRALVGGSGAAGGLSDPYISSVVFLSHFSGSNGATSPFPSSIGPNCNALGAGPTISTSQSVFGGTSLRSQTSGIYTGGSFTIGANDFTIEMWVRQDAVTSGVGQIMWDGRPALTNGIYPVITSTYQTLRYNVNSTDRISGGTLVATTWQFIALSRVSGSTRMYLGTAGNSTAAQVGSTYTDANTYLVAPVYLGNGSFGSGLMTGYIDDCRFTIGVGRYSGSTCPIPTAAFSDH